MAEKIFQELIAIGKDGHFCLRDENGNNVVFGAAGYQTSLDAIQDLLRRTVNSTSKADHEMMGQSVREPIRTLARYKQWTNIFFADWQLDPAEDNKIPVDNPIGAAFVSSTEGRPLYVAPGVQQFTRPNFFEVKTGVEIQWSLMRVAGWPILQRRMEEAADDAARKVDTKGRAILDAAIATASGHLSSISGGKLTKAGLDSVLKSAANIGFPITQGAVNPSRIMDMTDWIVGGTANYIPYFTGPDDRAMEVFRNLWANGYGGVTWLVSHSVPANSIYLSGDPAAVGYHQQHGGAQSASDVDIDRGVDKHVIREDHAFYVGNAYNLWNIIIQP